MLAPVWQYVTMVVLFSIAALLNLVGIAAVVFSDKKIVSTEQTFGPAGLFFRTIIAGFMMYVSYCLFVWYTGPLGLGIVLVHWASVISTFLYALISAGKKSEFTFGKSLWGTIYTVGMLVALIVYGLTCL